MIEAIVCTLCLNAMWLPRPLRLRWTGFPLAFAVIAAAWLAGVLPDAAYRHEWRPRIVASRVLGLTVGADVLQTIVHRASHTCLKGSVLGRSHQIHHRARRPTPYDAFATGTFDALAQLILPVLTLIHVLRPDRTSLTAFGALYSWWLHFLHSPPAPWHRRLRAIGLLTPKDHRAHHENPSSGFANVFRALDRAASCRT